MFFVGVIKTILKIFILFLNSALGSVVLAIREYCGVSPPIFLLKFFLTRAHVCFKARGGFA